MEKFEKETCIRLRTNPVYRYISSSYVIPYTCMKIQMCVLLNLGIDLLTWLDVFAENHKLFCYSLDACRMSDAKILQDDCSHDFNWLPLIILTLTHMAEDSLLSQNPFKIFVVTKYGMMSISQPLTKSTPLSLDSNFYNTKVRSSLTYWWS